MTAIGRAFVAVVPPAEVVDALAERVGAAQRSGDGVRWLSEWHVTLEFLGRVDDADTLASAVGAAVGGVARASVRLGGAGVFPKPARGTVVWIGVTEGAAAFEELASAVDQATGPLGHPPEARPFHPHVTVARASRPRGLGAIVAALGDEPVGPSWTLDAAVLLESHTRPTGAVHTEVARFPLRA
jgi:2'-5' RNA ligase